MKMKTVTTLFVLLVGVLALTGIASAINPSTVQELKINGEIVYAEGSDTPTVLAVEKGQDIEIKARIKALENITDAEVRAFMSGYKYRQNESDLVEDVIGPFDVDAGDTTFKTLKHFKNYSLIEVQITTGVRHQIRMHMTSIGYPIAGDKLYQKQKHKRPL